MKRESTKFLGAGIQLQSKSKIKAGTSWSVLIKYSDAEGTSDVSQNKSRAKFTPFFQKSLFSVRSCDSCNFNDRKECINADGIMVANTPTQVNLIFVPEIYRIVEPF